ncbi:MAG: tyrosine--tRNA ligase, partial [Candidatus Eremiobacteraeota bacterium]|nr:tyrosine--tRNA ligase [Candidatus Eremiobacteraeota bacterium]
HGADAARRAREHFEATVQRKEIPQGELAEIEVGEASRVAEVLVKAGFAQSRREAERLIAGNGVKVDGIAVSDPRAAWSATVPAVLAVGSRRFVRVLPRKG